MQSAGDKIQFFLGFLVVGYFRAKVDFTREILLFMPRPQIYGFRKLGFYHRPTDHDPN
jgi:hypothetical protein